MTDSIRQFRLDLKTRYSLLIITLVTSVVLVLTTVLMFEFRASTHRMSSASNQTSSSDLLDQLVERGAVMAATLAENLSNPMNQDDKVEMSELLGTMLTQRDVVAAYVFKADGKLMLDGANTSPEFWDKPKTPGLNVTLASGLPTSTIDEHQVNLVQAIKMDDNVEGAVYLILSRASTNQLITNAANELEEIVDQGLTLNFYTALLIGVAVVFAGTFIAIQTAKNLTKPISKLAIIAREIGNGNYPEAISLGRNDELGELAKALDEMNQKLQTTTESMRFMAYHDTLTGLPNRAMFKEMLENTVENNISTGGQGALMFIDLDHFKRINDTLGHYAGDTLLSEVASRLYQIAKEEQEELAMNNNSDITIARLGGDEFTVLLPQVDDSMEASLIARKILNRLQEPYILLERSFVVSASIGITMFPTDSDNPDQLLKNADMALYRSKENGRNAYHFYEDIMNQSALKHMELEGELRRALENHEFELHYQCQLDTLTNKVIGAEALIRWRHPVKGMISPADFIPLAEETGLIIDIGKWALNQACADVAWWRSSGKSQMYVAVNASAVQIMQASFLDDVKSAMKKSNLDSDALHIEITESSLLDDTTSASYIMKELSRLGVEVWMDDFGTGYSSLSHLRRFSFAGVKIDYSFVRNIVENAGDRSIILAIIAMAKSLGIRVVAEGVETEQQKKMLTHAKCDRLQGYLLSRPIPMDEFIETFIDSGTDETADYKQAS